MKSNRYVKATPRGGHAKAFTFNDDFEELKMITNEDNFNDPMDEVMMEEDSPEPIV